MDQLDDCSCLSSGATPAPESKACKMRLNQMLALHKLANASSFWLKCVCVLADPDLDSLHAALRAASIVGLPLGAGTVKELAALI